VVDNSLFHRRRQDQRHRPDQVAAQLAELSMDEFKALNPQFNRPVITGGDQTKILLPKSNAEKFNLPTWRNGAQALSSWTTHKITSARESIGTWRRASAPRRK
jgi:membrane-bound lytic murein transglycosylase D